jgi:hypothetical protein
MLRKIFGKKAVATQSAEPAYRPQPLDRDGTARVLSKELWDDPERAAFLTQMGYTPDMRSNVIETPEDRANLVKASALRSLKQELALKAELTAKHGFAVEIMSLPIIGQELWLRDADGTWLQEMMEYRCFDEWNVLILPTDAASAEVLGLPLHPRGPVPLLDETLAGFIRELRAQYGNCPSDADRRRIRAYVVDEVEILKSMLPSLLAGLAN